MTARRGWAAGPTDEEVDQAEARYLKALADPIRGSIDRQAIAAVLQSEYESDRRAIPVRLTGPAEINVGGLHVGAMFSRQLAAAPALAVPILPADPRRAVVMLSQQSLDGSTVVIGRSQAEANDVSGFTFHPNQQGPYAFHFTEELWARATNATIRLSVLTELWVR